MQPFEVNVLDKRRTLTEKLVSLMRCSLADIYIPPLAIRYVISTTCIILCKTRELKNTLKANF